MDTKILLIEISTHVEGLFSSDAKPYLLYHNLEHTRQVVTHAKEIAAHYTMEEDVMFILLSASWFHDTGHLIGEMEEHEILGVHLMRRFLDGRVKSKVLDEIDKCIMATKMPASPLSICEEILCDADTYHFGTPDFQRTDALVWSELEIREGKIFPNKAKKSLDLLTAHTFFTSYCQQLLSEGKKKNIAWLKKQIATGK